MRDSRQVVALPSQDIVNLRMYHKHYFTLNQNHQTFDYMFKVPLTKFSRCYDILEITAIF